MESIDELTKALQNHASYDHDALDRKIEDHDKELELARTDLQEAGELLE